MPHFLPTAYLAVLDTARHLAYLAGMPAIGPWRLDMGWWDRAYDSGRNRRYVDDDHEWERLAVSAALALHGRPGAAVLDLGCGTGRLLSYMHTYGVRRYIGVDFSSAALEVARSQEGSCAVVTATNGLDGLREAPIDVTWIHADLETWRPSEPIDVVFISEVLYYLPREAEVLGRVLGTLRPGGVVVVSMWEDRRRWMQWKSICRAIGRRGARSGPSAIVTTGALSWKIRSFIASAV